MAKDANKDQTYFLYRIREEALAKTLFPLGGYTKPEIREMAEARGLVTATKKDSQGICFVGKVGIRDFLSQYVQAVPGDIVEKDSSKVLGQHDGAIFYTIGQRQGLGLGGGLPYYVVGKDMDKNEVYVTTQIDDKALWHKDLELNSVHWINYAPEIDQTVLARIRHRAKLITAKVTASSDGIVGLELTDAERAITAGQSTVLYDGNRVIGGGIVS
jgi:tRNA-specific 2-thiouridylase